MVARDDRMGEQALRSETVVSYNMMSIAPRLFPAVNTLVESSLQIFRVQSS